MTRIALARQFAKGVAASIVGAAKAVHFEDAVHVVDLSHTDEDVKYLEDAYVPHRIVGALEAKLPIREYLEQAADKFENGWFFPNKSQRLRRRKE